MLENTKNILSMENHIKFDVLGFEQKELDTVLALKIRDVRYRKFITDGEATEIKYSRTKDWMFVHITKGTFIRIIERGEGENAKKRISVILTPKADASKYKIHVQFRADF